MFDGVQARTFCKHPSGKDTPNAAIQRNLVNFDKGCGFGLLGHRTGETDPWGDLQLTKFHGLIDIDIKGVRDAGNFVDSGKHGDAVLDALGMGHAQTKGESDYNHKRGKKKFAHWFVDSGQGLTAFYLKIMAKINPISIDRWAIKAIVPGILGVHSLQSIALQHRTALVLRLFPPGHRLLHGGHQTDQKTAHA